MRMHLFSSYWMLVWVLVLLLVAQGLATAATSSVGEGLDQNPHDVAGGGGSNGIGTGEDSTTREEILRNREKRKRQLRNVINQMRKQLADHSAGEITLQPKEKADIERRLDLHFQKLDTFNRDLDEKVR